MDLLYVYLLAVFSQSDGVFEFGLGSYLAYIGAWNCFPQLFRVDEKSSIGGCTFGFEYFRHDTRSYDSVLVECMQSAMVGGHCKLSVSFLLSRDPFSFTFATHVVGLFG